MSDPMSSEASATTFSVVEPGQVPRLVELMAAGLREEGARKADIFNREFWDWQYRRAPAGPAKVYGAFIKGELAGYYHVPLYRMMIGGRVGLAGEIQDVAVRPWAQGRGVFRRLSAFAHADLESSGVDLLYTFPNSRSVHNLVRAGLRAAGRSGYKFPNSSSIHTFLKYDKYKKVRELRSWVAPMDSAAILKMKGGRAASWLGAAADRALRLTTARVRAGGSLETRRDFTSEVAGLFAPRPGDSSATLVRDPAYLKWRFFERPGSNYTVVSYREGGRVTAAAVFKPEPLFGVPALLMMDHAVLPGKDADMIQLLLRLRDARQDIFPEHFDLILAASAPDFAPNPLLAGFLPIPGPLNPRRINLLARSFSGDTPAANLWRVRLSDWDVF